MTKILFLSHKETEAYSLYLLSASISSTPKPKDSTAAAEVSATGASTSFKSDLYDAPRRSLRQKGMVPEGRGFPYYSPSKIRLTSQSFEVESSQKAGDVSMNDTRDTEESSNEERIEDDTVSSIKGGETSATNDGSQSENELSSRYKLTNKNVRRQIIQDPHSDSVRSGSAGQNGVASPPESSVSMQYPSGTRGGTNSVQTAAEALVAMATPTRGSLRGSKEEPMMVESNGSRNRASRSPPNGRTSRSGRSVSLVLDNVWNGESSSSNSVPPARQAQVSVDGRGLLELFERIVKGTDGCSVEEMERIHTTYKQLVFRHRMSWQREDLIEVS